MTIRNYLLHGGSNNVAYRDHLWNPESRSVARDTNLDSEFNGKGHYLQLLNHAYSDDSEVPPGVNVMTLRSDKLDKYAQPKASLSARPRDHRRHYAGPALEAPKYRHS